MTFCFIFDISVDMTNRVWNQLSCMDMSKAVVELFIQTCARQQLAIPMMVCKTDDNRGCILTSFGESIGKVEDIVKQLQADMYSSKNFSYTLSHVLSIFGKFRVRSGIDRYGCGISPWIIDPVNMVLFTNYDGILRSDGLEVTSPLRHINLSDMSLRPYRWDQKIFVIVIISEGDNRILTGNSPLERLSKVILSLI